MTKRFTAWPTGSRASGARKLCLVGHCLLRAETNVKSIFCELWKNNLMVKTLPMYLSMYRCMYNLYLNAIRSGRNQGFCPFKGLARGGLSADATVARVTVKKCFLLVESLSDIVRWTTICLLKVTVGAASLKN
jgi:hypothetical protein